jgi:hypothetical protein
MESEYKMMMSEWCWAVRKRVNMGSSDRCVQWNWSHSPPHPASQPGSPARLTSPAPPAKPSFPLQPKGRGWSRQVVTQNPRGNMLRNRKLACHPSALASCTSTSAVDLRVWIELWHFLTPSILQSSTVDEQRAESRE